MNIAKSIVEKRAGIRSYIGEAFDEFDVNGSKSDNRLARILGKTEGIFSEQMPKFIGSQEGKAVRNLGLAGGMVGLLGSKKRNKDGDPTKPSLMDRLKSGLLGGAVGVGLGGAWNAGRNSNTLDYNSEILDPRFDSKTLIDTVARDSSSQNSRQLNGIIRALYDIKGKSFDSFSDSHSRSNKRLLNELGGYD